MSTNKRRLYIESDVAMSTYSVSYSLSATQRAPPSYSFAGFSGIRNIEQNRNQLKWLWCNLMNQHYTFAQRKFRWKWQLRCIESIAVYRCFWEREKYLDTNRLKSLIRRLLAGVDILVSSTYATNLIQVSFLILKCFSYETFHMTKSVNYVGLACTQKIPFLSLCRNFCRHGQRDGCQMTMKLAIKNPASGQYRDVKKSSVLIYI